MPDPPNGSRTNPFSGESNFIKNAGNATGKTAGWPKFLPTKGIFNTFEGSTCFFPTHLVKSRPNPLLFSELCLINDFPLSFASLGIAQSPVGIFTVF